MSTTWIIIVIVLVLGVVIGNITLLKYSAKFKCPTPSKPFDDEGDEYDDEYDNPNKDANRPHAENETAGDHASLKQTNNGSGDNAKKSVK